MITRFIIDLTTGLVTRSIADVAESEDLAAILTAGDTMECEVVFMAGATDVTAATLADDVPAALGVRAVPGVEPLLAMSTPIVLEAEVGVCTLDLRTAEIAALVGALGSTKTSTKVWFEAVVGGLTVAQVRMILHREVIGEGDEPPPAAELSRMAAGASAAAAALSALDADGARQAAQAAQSTVEAARDAAQASVTAAATSATDAAGSAAVADTARLAAQQAKADTDAARNVAQGAASSAGASETNAGNSATAAAASAADAANCTAAAAVSATDAANAAADSGTSATNAAGSAAAAAASAGTAAAISANVRNALAPQAAVACDGSAAANRLTWALPASCALGSDPRGLTFKIETPPAAPSSTTVFFSWGDAASPTTQFLELAHTAGDALRIRIYGVTTADYRERTFAGLLSNYGASRALIATLSADSAGLALYLNGVAASLTAETTGGSAPVDWQAALTSTVAAWHGGLAYKVYSWWPMNFAPTLADAVDIHLLGGGVPEKYKWGSAQLNTYANKAWAYGDLDTNASDSLGGGTGAWSIAAIADTRTGGVGNYVIQCVCNNISNSLIVTHNFPVVTLLRLGQNIRATAWFKGSTSANGIIVHGRAINYSAELFASIPVNFSLSQTWMKKSFVATVSASGTLGCFGWTISASASPSLGDAINIDDLKISLLGALFFASPHAAGDASGYQLHDISANRIDGLMPMSGWTWTHAAPRGYVRGTLTWAGTHEPKSLIGQRAFPDGFVLSAITLKSTAATSGGGSTIGTANSGTRWRGLTALTANTKSIVTLANQLPAGTANGDADLVIDPDTANYTGSISIEAHYIVTLGS